jgi:hypothetical protein
MEVIIHQIINYTLDELVTMVKPKEFACYEWINVFNIK